MATLPIIGRKFSDSVGGNTYLLGDSAQGDLAGTMAILLVASSLTGGSVTVAAVTKGDAVKDAVAPVAVPYKSLFLNGVVGTGGLVSTAITGTSLIHVPASGLNVALTIAAISAGGWTIYSWPIEGAAA